MFPPEMGGAYLGGIKMKKLVNKDQVVVVSMPHAALWVVQLR